MMRFLPQVSVFCTLDFSGHGHNYSETPYHGRECLSLFPAKNACTVHPHKCQLYTVDTFSLPQIPLSVCGSGMTPVHCVVREGVRQRELGKASEWVRNNSCAWWGCVKIFRKIHLAALEHLPLKWWEFSEREGSNKHTDGYRCCSFLLCKVRIGIESSFGTQYATCFVVQHLTHTHYQTSCFKV